MTYTEIKESLEGQMMTTIPDYDWQLISNKLDQALAEERERVREIVEQIIQEERFSGTPYSMNRLLSFLDNPLTGKE